jgi:hypothetical protein
VYRWQPSRLTTEGTLGYQILAGRLAQFCTLLLESLPAGDPAASVEFLRGELAGFLGPLAGEVAGAAGEATAGAAAGATTATTAGAGTGAAEAHAGAVTVELITQEVEGVSRPFAQVAVRPQAPIEGKPIDFQFLLPLRG